MTVTIGKKNNINSPNDSDVYPWLKLFNKMDLRRLFPLIHQESVTIRKMSQQRSYSKPEVTI